MRTSSARCCGPCGVPDLPASLEQPQPVRPRLHRPVLFGREARGDEVAGLSALAHRGDDAVALAGRRAGAPDHLVEHGAEVEALADAQDRRVRAGHALARGFALPGGFIAFVQRLLLPGLRPPRAARFEQWSLQGQKRNKRFSRQTISGNKWRNTIVMLFLRAIVLNLSVFGDTRRLSPNRPVAWRVRRFLCRAPVPEPGCARRTRWQRRGYLRVGGDTEMELTAFTKSGRRNRAHRRDMTARTAGSANIPGGGDLPATDPAVAFEACHGVAIWRKLRPSGPAAQRLPV